MLEENIKEIVDPIAAEHTARVIQVKLLGGDKYKTLQIFAERADGDRLSIDAIGKLSREIAYHFDVEDVVDSRYTLEVSSPGLDRPLVSLEDFKKHKGFLVKVKLGISVEHEEIGSFRKIKGRIESVSDSEKITLITEEKKTSVELDFDNIASANIEITDRLIKEQGKMN